MKKTLKIMLVVAFLAIALFALTGCGNKLVATRESEEMGMKMEEKVEISFKNDKVNKVKMTFTFDDKDTAESMKSLLSLGFTMSGESSEGFEIKQSGKKVIIELDSKSYASMGNEYAGLSKEELKEQLEEDGYKVK